MQQAEKTKVPRRSTGNVFEDLGFPAEEAAILQLKTDLKIAIEREVERRKLTPKKLAQVLDVQQPQVSDLLTGKVAKMTLDKLTKYAHRLGMRVEVKARSPQRPRRLARSVVA